MKLIYIISMGHSGSTLFDSILGTHPQFFSTGEMRYLGWQLWRTKSKKATIKDQDICTCNENFRECLFWSNVFKHIKDECGKDIQNDPKSFKINFFNQFAFNDRGTKLDHIKAYFTRLYLELGLPLNIIINLFSSVKRVLDNRWMLYETISKISNKSVIVDSSKHLTEGLILQQSRPNDVYFVFIHRDVRALVSSAQRWKHQTTIKNVVKEKKVFEKRVNKYKKNISNLNFIDINYEDFVSKPASILKDIEKLLKIPLGQSTQNDDSFFIEPNKLHIVAGNPMRYRGRMKVELDERWKSELSDEQLDMISKYRTS